MTALSFTVHGRPAGQGSKKYFGPGRVVEQSKNVKPWREAVKAAALDAIDAQGWERLDGPVHVTLGVFFKRPKHHFRGGRFSNLLRENAPAWHTSTPDADKVARACLDALTESEHFESPDVPFEGVRVEVHPMPVGWLTS